MRIGLISDIHGLVAPLEAVLSALALRSVDQIVCLGDVAFGPQPHEVLQHVRALGCPVIMGNADARLLDPTIPASVATANAWVRAMSEWCSARLDGADRAFIRSFLPTLTLEMGKDTLLCYHGSPQSYFDEIYATTPDERLAQMVRDTDATILAGGHTHRQMYRRWQQRAVINCGSVGRPYDGNVHMTRVLPWAEYAVITAHHEHLAVDLCQVAMDVDALRRQIHNSGMPGAENWAADYPH